MTQRVFHRALVTAAIAAVVTGCGESKTASDAGMDAADREVGGDAASDEQHDVGVAVDGGGRDVGDAPRDAAAETPADVHPVDALDRPPSEAGATDGGDG